MPTPRVTKRTGLRHTKHPQPCRPRVSIIRTPAIPAPHTSHRMRSHIEQHAAKRCALLHHRQAKCTAMGRQAARAAATTSERHGTCRLRAELPPAARRTAPIARPSPIGGGDESSGGSCSADALVASTTVPAALLARCRPHSTQRQGTPACSLIASRLGRLLRAAAKAAKHLGEHAECGRAAQATLGNLAKHAPHERPE